MKVINPQFILQNRTRLFVEQSILKLVRQNQRLTGETCYWLYYYVKTDYDAILNSFLNYDIDMDFLGFPNQHKTIRHQIEAFLDLYNLFCDPGYTAVLRFNNRENVPLGKYEKELGNGSFFNNQQKMNMAKKNNFQYAWYLEKIIRTANHYVHPNVYHKQIAEEDKEKLIREIMGISSFLLGEAYQLIVRAFAPEGLQPDLMCENCSFPGHNCGACFMELYHKDRYFISEADDLFIEYDYQPTDFQTVY